MNRLQIPQVSIFSYTILFITLEAFIYITYLSMDFLSLHTLKISDIFKYSGIVLCFIYTLVQNAADQFSKRQSRCLLACAFLVLFSDYCLLFTTHYLPGVIIFILVQCLYFTAMARPRLLPHFLALSAALAIPAALFLNSLCKLNGPLINAAAIYMSMLVINIVCAVRYFYKSRNVPALLFALGMVLYSLCDLSVGLMNLPAFFGPQTPRLLYIFASPYFQEITTYAMWLFYLPAQVLIALSHFSLKNRSFS